MLQIQLDPCGKSLDACQNPAMRRLLAFALSASLAGAAGCSRDPSDADTAATPTEMSGTWLGAPRVQQTPAAIGSRFPHLAATADGSILVMSWLEPVNDAGAFRLRMAQWQDGRRWADPTDVATGMDWFVNWADFPSVMPATDGPWAAHWLQQKPGGVYSYDVMVKLSDDGGRTWSEPLSPHDDGTPTEHGFVSLTSVGGQPYAIWLDGRATAGEGHAHGADEHGSTAGAMTLRGAVLQSKGATAGAQIDERVCDCCQTDTAATRDALVVTYRDRGMDETRDIRMARMVNGAWSEPIVVHADGWRIDACPVNGPAVAARGDDVMVAWFTAPDQPRVRLAFSRDGGRTFDAPIEVASGKVVGRVDVVALDDGRAVVSWLADGAKGAVIRAQPFTSAGAAGLAVDIAQADIARSAGFPQMLRAPGGLLFAWTTSGAEPKVRTAFAPLP
jgi:hypothetical protein